MVVLAAVATAASAARRRRRRRRRQQRRRRLCKWGFDGFADGTLTDYIIQIRARPSNRPGPLTWLKCRGPSNRLSHAVTGWWSPLDDSLWCRRCGASTAATSTLWQATAGSPHGTLGHVGLLVEFQLTIAPLSLPRPGTNLTGDTALRGTNLTGAMALPGAHSPLPRPFARTRGHIHAHAYTHVELRVRRFAGFISTASTSEFYGAATSWRREADATAPLWSVVPGCALSGGRVQWRLPRCTRGSALPVSTLRTIAVSGRDDRRRSRITHDHIRMNKFLDRSPEA